MFASTFLHAGGMHASTTASTGQYVQVTNADMQKIPEGMSGEIADEFEVNSFEGEEKYWMIRDSSKLCCQILDEFKAKKNSYRPPNEPTALRRLNVEDYGMKSKF